MTTNKRTVFNRFLSLLLVVTMSLSMMAVPAQAASSETLTNGMPVTEENVLALMNEYKNGKEPGEKAKATGFTSYMEEAMYDAYNPTYRLNPFGDGKECAKFAFAFWDDLFGDVQMREITNPEDVRPGDLLHFPGHWAIATKGAFSDSDGDLCTMTVSGGVDGQIGWGNVYNTIGNDRLTEAYTRYPLTWQFDEKEYIFDVEAEAGSSFESLNLDSTIRVWATRGDQHNSFYIPIIWDSESYNPWISPQTIIGELDLSDFPEFNGIKSPSVTAEIMLEGEIGITDISVEQPTNIVAKLGTVWSELDVPGEVSVSIIYADGEVITETVDVIWTEGLLKYDPNGEDPQIISGRISVPNDSPLNNLDSEWLNKLKSEVVELEVFLENTATQISVENTHFEIEGHFGDTWDDLNAPDTVMAIVGMGSGELNEREFVINWSNSAYNPLLPKQEFTGSINIAGSGYVDIDDIPESELPALTLTITLTRDENDAVESIETITPVAIWGSAGLSFKEQPCPKTVRVRITYASGTSLEADASVTWQEDGFDPTAAEGETQYITGILSFSNDEIPAGTDPEKLTIEAEMFMSIIGTGITLPSIPEVSGYLGDKWEDLRGVPETLNVTVQMSDGTSVQEEMMVYWTSDYNPNAATQTIHGTLPVDAYISTMGLPSPDVVLVINLSEKGVYASDFEKIYDGKQTALPVTKPEGCVSVSIHYAGTTLAGKNVSGNFAPSQAGDYTATVSFTMQPGYSAIVPFSVAYIINPVEREFNTPVKVAYTMNNSIGLVPVEGAEYRIEGGEWQDSTLFNRLLPDTTYTFYQRLKATDDGNYTASTETSVIARTQTSSSHDISVPFEEKYASKVYDGIGLFADGTNYSLSLGGSPVSVRVSAYLSTDFSENPALDAFSETDIVNNPTSAGPYIICYQLPAGYIWTDTGDQKMYSSVWIYPKFSDIYVGDAFSDITMETGSSDAYASNYKLQFSLAAGESTFDTSHTGETKVPVLVSAAKAGVSAVVVEIPGTVLPWTVTNKDVPTVKIANDAVFDESMLPAAITVTAKARDKEQEFQVPVSWDISHYTDLMETQTVPGTLNYDGINELEGVDNVSVSAVVTRLAAPTYVPFEAKFEDKTYDGIGLFDAGKDYTVAVGEADIAVQVTAYLADNNGASEQADGNPTAAGKYVIRYSLPDAYYWEGTSSQAKDAAVWIYPDINSVYVGDQLTDVTFTSGDGAFSFAAGTSPDFQTNVSGETIIAVNITGVDFSEMIDLQVNVLSWNVIKKETVEITGKYGMAFGELVLPDTIKVIAHGSGDPKEFSVPAAWSDVGYDASLETQEINGTLDCSLIPELSDIADKTITAKVNLAMNQVDVPAISGFTKTYDQTAAPIPLPELPVGIDSCTVSYTGTSYAGTAYGPSTEAPVNAGNYTATVSFVMTPGYAQLGNVDVSYTVNKAAQSAPAAIDTIIVSYDSVVLRAVDGAEYSLDGVIWQDKSSFYGLTANTQYTLYMRMPETADGNYSASDPISKVVVTAQRQAQTPVLDPYTVTYTGTAQEYKVSAITSVRNINIVYALNGEVLSSTPVDAGEYDVSISFDMETGYKQLENMTSKLIILKAPQDAPVAAVTAASDASLTIANISGTEYSIDGGSTWQTSNVFTDLNRNTKYTVLVRLAEDKNHAASSAVEVTGTTSMTTAQVPSSLPSYTARKSSFRFLHRKNAQSPKKEGSIKRWLAGA